MVKFAMRFVKESLTHSLTHSATDKQTEQALEPTVPVFQLFHATLIAVLSAPSCPPCQTQPLLMVWDHIDCLVVCFIFAQQVHTPCIRK